MFPLRIFSRDLSILLLIVLSDLLPAQQPLDLTASIQVLGTPTSGTNLTGRDRSVWDLQCFDGRIYLGSGNTTTNPGKNIVWSYFPETGTFTNELLANTEAIEHYRMIGGRLFLPAADPQTGDSTKFYYRDIGGTWTLFEHNYPLAHVRDMIAAPNGDLIGVGNTRDPGNKTGIVRFNIAANTLTTLAIAGDPAKAGVLANLHYSLFNYLGETYSTSTLLSPTASYYSVPDPAFEERRTNGIARYDSGGNRFVLDDLHLDPTGENTVGDSDFIKILAQSSAEGTSEQNYTTYCVSSHLEKSGSLIYALRSYCPFVTPENFYRTLYQKSQGMFVKTSLQSPPATVTFPGAPLAIGEDLLSIGGMIYALANQKNTDGSFIVSVHRTATPAIASSWEPLFQFSSGNRCKSFAFHKNRFYFGLGADSGESTTQAGSLLALTYAASALTFAEWSAGIDWGATPANQRNPGNDPDGDGRDNASERAFGGDPSKADPSPSGKIELTINPDGSRILKAFYKKGAPEMSYVLQQSKTLDNWADASVGSESYDASKGLYYRTWIAPADQPRWFTRIKATDAP